MYGSTQLEEHRISASASFAVHDREDEYDVLYMPSRQPYVVMPSGTLDADAREHDRYYDLRASFDLSERDVIPPPSPTYSFASDFVFPNPHMYDDVMSKAGYSDFFKQGLLSQSYRNSRRLDGVIRWIGRGIQSTKRRLSASL